MLWLQGFLLWHIVTLALLSQAAATANAAFKLMACKKYEQLLNSVHKLHQVR